MTYTERLQKAGEKSFAVVKKVAREISKIAKDYTKQNQPPTSLYVLFSNGLHGYMPLDYIPCGKFKVAFVDDAKRGTIAVIAKNL